MYVILSTIQISEKIASERTTAVFGTNYSWDNIICKKILLDGISPKAFSLALHKKEGITSHNPRTKKHKHE